MTTKFALFSYKFHLITHKKYGVLERVLNDESREIDFSSGSAAN